MSGKTIALLAVIVIVIALAGFGITYVTTYNSMVASRNQVRADYSFVLAAYDRFDSNVLLSKQVAQYSVKSQVNLVEIATALREGGSLNTSSSTYSLNQQVGQIQKLDGITTQFLLTYTAEAYPKLDITSLTALQATIESGLRVVNDARNTYSQDVQQYNTNIQSIPAGWFDQTFGWNFNTLQSYTSNPITPESLANQTLFP
jgi:hypothetical protein